jgi:glycosyltransferase involved in cell wall biosynthesis
VYDRQFVTDLLRPALRRAVLALAPDVIHCQGFVGMPMRRLFARRLPLLTTIHGTLWSETALRRGAPALDRRPTARARLHWRFKHRHLAAPLWRRFLRVGPPDRHHELIVDSRFSRRELAREARWGEGPDGRPPIHIVPLGFDMGRFPRIGAAAAAARWEKPAGARWFVAVGRMERGKGFDILLDAFSRVAESMPGASLLLAGRGSQRLALMKHRRMLPPEIRPRIVFLDAVPDHDPSVPEARDLASLIEAADFFLNADQGAPAFGLANAEALCMGTPVIASNAGAHREVVLEDDGVLVDSHDAAAWAEAMRTAVPDDDPARRAARAERARRRFDRALMVRRLVAIYRRAATRFREAPR